MFGTGSKDENDDWYDEETIMVYNYSQLPSSNIIALKHNSTGWFFVIHNKEYEASNLQSILENDSNFTYSYSNPYRIYTSSDALCKIGYGGQVKLCYPKNTSDGGQLNYYFNGINFQCLLNYNEDGEVTRYWCGPIIRNLRKNYTGQYHSNCEYFCS